MCLWDQGARPTAAVVGHAIRLVLISLTIELAGGLAFGRAMASGLHGVTATDPATYSGVALVWATIAVLASYFPALQATRVDPIRALRLE